MRILVLQGPPAHYAILDIPRSFSPALDTKFHGLYPRLAFLIDSYETLVVNSLRFIISFDIYINTVTYASITSVFFINTPFSFLAVFPAIPTVYIKIDNCIFVSQEFL